MVAINPAARLSGSDVFNGRDSTRYEVLMANTREEAKRVARGEDFVVLEVVHETPFGTVQQFLYCHCKIE